MTRCWVFLEPDWYWSSEAGAGTNLREQIYSDIDITLVTRAAAKDYFHYWSICWMFFLHSRHHICRYWFILDRCWYDQSDSSSFIWTSGRPGHWWCTQNQELNPNISLKVSFKKKNVISIFFLTVSHSECGRQLNVQYAKIYFLILLTACLNGAFVGR